MVDDWQSMGEGRCTVILALLWELGWGGHVSLICGSAWTGLTA